MKPGTVKALQLIRSLLLGAGCLFGCLVATLMIMSVYDSHLDTMPDIAFWLGLAPSAAWCWLALWRSAAVGRELRLGATGVWLTATVVAAVLLPWEAAVYVGLGLGLQLAWLVVWARRTGQLWGGRVAPWLFGLLAILSAVAMNAALLGAIPIAREIDYLEYMDFGDLIDLCQSFADEWWAWAYVVALAWFVLMAVLTLLARWRAKRRLREPAESTARAADGESGWSPMATADESESIG